MASPVRTHPRREPASTRRRGSRRHKSNGTFDGDTKGAFNGKQNSTLEGEPNGAFDEEATNAFKRQANGAFDGIVHASHEMKRVLAMTFDYARMDMPVLITGETGTGKELIARAVHDASARAGGPFVVVDCAAMPAPLLENELFGHERGAYTDAKTKQPGLVAAAHGGSLFLDEIGELPPTAQSALLRVLSERTFRPLGSPREVSSDVRVVAATNRDLRQAVDQGAFRLDLLHRIRSAVLDLPPLRSRAVDIPPLVRHFIRKMTPEVTRQPAVSPEAMERLLSHGWEGNVRELEHRIESAIARAMNGKNGLISIADLFPEDSAGIDPNGEMPSLQSYRDEMAGSAERDYLDYVLRMTGGNVSRAARLAGTHRTHLYRLCRQHGIEPMAFRNGR